MNKKRNEINHPMNKTEEKKTEKQGRRVDRAVSTAHTTADGTWGIWFMSRRRVKVAAEVCVVWGEGVECGYVTSGRGGVGYTHVNAIVPRVGYVGVACTVEGNMRERRGLPVSLVCRRVNIRPLHIVK